MNRSHQIIAAFASVLLIDATHAVAQLPNAPMPSANGLPTTEPASPRGRSQRTNTAVDATVFPAAVGRDQADALQQALDELQPGDHLVLSPAQYIVGHSLKVRTPQVVISGYGATLVATNPNDQTIVMNGSNSTLLGLTLIGTGKTRLTTPDSTKVEVTGTGVQVLDVTIKGSASGGIFVFGATDVAIVRNTVQGTLADGIHVTHGSRNVLVQHNTVRGTGDDMIAVVSYLGDGALCSNVLITGNSVSDNYWGRGISVVGGTNVTISDNEVRGVQKAAGVLVAQEDSWRTYSTTNVLIANNVISDIENSTNLHNDLPAAQQAAIDLNAGSGKVARVSVTGNHVSRSTYAGFRALGNVCRFDVSGNAFASIAGTPISILSRNCLPSQVTGHSNMLFDEALISPVGSTLTDTPDVTGANAALMPRIRTYLMHGKAPS